MAYKEIKGPQGHDFDNDGPVEGRYIEAVKNSFGKEDFIVQPRGGKKITVLGHVALASKMSQVKPGQDVRITRLEKKPNKAGTQNYFDYKVEVLDEDEE